jgi:hypothetical protein
MYYYLLLKFVSINTGYNLLCHCITLSSYADHSAIACGGYVSVTWRKVHCIGPLSAFSWRPWLFFGRTGYFPEISKILFSYIILLFFLFPFLLALINCTKCCIVIFSYMHIMYFDQIHPFYYSFLTPSFLPPFLTVFSEFH